ncbi:hypothetical protein LOD99_5297 [Oopsacas minuta]|uniref:Uncharacterized protein n=1 Tax=Oopsacas minuta TaxID=111878 RepID=A0AAV7JRP1_9METZ|nr:hypothetical protein LOD99_5292 [Oopsacas minuta]KAI6651331.1 hypothetical protein LOD99_5297 [Oopsacas minuta]
MVIVKRTNEHSHDPDEQTAGCWKRRQWVSLHPASGGIVAKLSQLDSLKRTIQRQRASVLAAPAQPTTLAELVLPAEYQQTAKGEQFLLYDSGEGDVHRFLMFGTQRYLRILRQSKIWLADDTFKTHPPLFAQVCGAWTPWRRWRFEDRSSVAEPVRATAQQDGG